MPYLEDAAPGPIELPTRRGFRPAVAPERRGRGRAVRATTCSWACRGVGRHRIHRPTRRSAGQSSAHRASSGAKACSLTASRQNTNYQEVALRTVPAR